MRERSRSNNRVLVFRCRLCSVTYYKQLANLLRDLAAQRGASGDKQPPSFLLFGLRQTAEQAEAPTAKTRRH